MTKLVAVFCFIFSFGSQAGKEPAVGYWTEQDGQRTTMHFSPAFPELQWFEPALLSCHLQYKTKAREIWMSQGPDGTKLVFIDPDGKVREKAVSQLHKKLKIRLMPVPQPKGTKDVRARLASRFLFAKESSRHLSGGGCLRWSA